MNNSMVEHISSDPNICGGKPCIAGTRIRVWDIYVASEWRGETPDQIVAQYPRLTLAQVHAALAFYWDNREAIDLQMKAADVFVEQLKQRLGLGPLAKKLTNVEVEDDSIPS